MPLPLRGLPSALLRYYCGPTVAQINGVSASNAWAWLFTTGAWSMRHLGLIAPRDKIARVAARQLGAGVLGTFVNKGRTGTRPAFTLPEQLDQEVHDARKRWTL